MQKTICMPAVFLGSAISVVNSRERERERDDFGDHASCICGTKWNGHGAGGGPRGVPQPLEAGFDRSSHSTQYIFARTIRRPLAQVGDRPTDWVSAQPR